MKNRKKTAIFLIIAALTAGGLGGCAPAKGGEEVILLATFYPIQIALLNIASGIEGVQVRSLAPPTAGCLHDYQLTTADRALIDQAHVLVINGAGMEEFLAPAIGGARMIDASAGFSLLDPFLEHADEHGDEHMENSHVWVAPEGAIYQAERIRDGLMELDPDRAGQYYANANAYIDSLLELQSNMHASLEPYKGQKVVALHDSFAYFAREFSLDVVAVLKAEPESQLSAKEIGDAAKAAREQGAVAIFSEMQYDDSAAQTLSRETGIQVYALDSVVTGEEGNANAYLEAMDYNTTAIAMAMGYMQED